MSISNWIKVISLKLSNDIARIHFTRDGFAVIVKDHSFSELYDLLSSLSKAVQEQEAHSSVGSAYNVTIFEATPDDEEVPEQEDQAEPATEDRGLIREMGFLNWIKAHISCRFTKDIVRIHVSKKGHIIIIKETLVSELPFMLKELGEFIKYMELNSEEGSDYSLLVLGRGLEEKEKEEEDHSEDYSQKI